MMRRVRETFSRLRAMFDRSRLDQDFDEEYATHLALLIERNERKGFSREEARRQAVLQMGGASAVKDIHREARGLPALETLVQAFWQAWRSWRSAKAVAVLAATALAVGIGAATGMYTVVNAVMLKPLPYQNADRFVVLFAADVSNPNSRTQLDSRDAQKFQERTRSFDAFGWFRGAGKNLTFAGEPHHVRGVMVTEGLVHQLGVEPMLGRWFHDDGGVVISNSLWRRLGSDPGIVGKGLTLDGRAYVVTGVMPEFFQLPVAGVTAAGSRSDVWIPLNPRERAGSAYVAYARLKPDVTLAAAADEVKRVAAQIAAEDPREHQGYTARLVDLRETVIREIRPTLMLLFAAAGLLFLITCANAAGLLLVRSMTRTRETALRIALGASRTQLAVHYFAEGLLISLAAAVAGVILGITLTPAIVAMAANYLPRAEDVRMDWTVLLFALGAACVSNVLSSIAPLWQALRTAPADVLRDGLRASAGVPSRRASQSLVVAEIAFAFALLAGSSLLVFHLRSLYQTSPGFDADHVLSFAVSLPGPIASEPEKRLAVQANLVSSIGAIPGVELVAFANQLPLRGCCRRTTLELDGRPESQNRPRDTSVAAVSPAYFGVIRIPLLNGRLLTDSDHVQNPELIPTVISRSVARRDWPGRDPLGAVGWFDYGQRARFTVVGVVEDVKNIGLLEPSRPEVYLPAAYMRIESMRFVVRSARPEASLLSDIRRAVRSVDPEQPVHDVATMHEVIQETITLERTASFLTTFFAAAALLLAMLGVYGVVLYSVRQRHIEIGTRKALGASSRNVLALVIGGELKMASVGLLIGGLASIGAATYLGRVFEIDGSSAGPYLYSVVIVVALTLAALLLPAWRATVISPMVAMRNEMR